MIEKQNNRQKIHTIYIDDGDYIDFGSIIDVLKISPEKFDIHKLSIKLEVGQTWYEHDIPQCYLLVSYNDD